MSRHRRYLGVASILVIATAVTTVIAGAPAQALDLRCSRSWHYITHGETGRNVRPLPDLPQGNMSLFANGVPGADSWNQQFLFCRDPAWDPDVYAIYSNLTARYWTMGPNDGVDASAPEVTTRAQQFVVRRYDSTWWVIRSRDIAEVLTPYVAPDRAPYQGNALEVTGPPLTGNHLFMISPANLMG